MTAGSIAPLADDALPTITAADGAAPDIVPFPLDAMAHADLEPVDSAGEADEESERLAA